jgi:hypothetical protein
MFAKSLKIAAAAAMTVATLVPAAAQARGWGHDGYYDRGYYGQGYGRGYYGRGYDAPRGYYGARYYDRHHYGRGYCRDKGTGGTIIGAGVGALAGRAIDRDC